MFWNYGIVDLIIAKHKFGTDNKVNHHGHVAYQDGKLLHNSDTFLKIDVLFSAIMHIQWKTPL